MESKYNPFVNRYPNRRKIISSKDRESEILIEKQKNLKLSKNLSSLNENNKKLNLFVKHQKEEEINFPTKFSNYGQIPEIIQNNLSKLKLETLTPIQNLAFGYLFKLNLFNIIIIIFSLNILINFFMKIKIKMRIIMI